MSTIITSLDHSVRRRPCYAEKRFTLFSYESGYVENIRDDAVVGHFPILNPTSPTFSYCSICQGRILDDRSPSQVVSNDPDAVQTMATMGSSLHAANDTGTIMEIDAPVDSDHRFRRGPWPFDWAVAMEGSFEFTPGTIVSPSSCKYVISNAFPFLICVYRISRLVKSFQSSLDGLTLHSRITYLACWKRNIEKRSNM
jgi:hypothetical protein